MYTVRAPAASGRLVVDGGPGLKYFAKGTQPDRDVGGLFEPPSRTFDYLDWIACLTSHIPEQNTQLVHYSGAYANAHRGKEAKGASAPPDASPVMTEPEDDWIKARRKAWARLIQQVCEADPLLCDCGSKFEVISVIEARMQSDVVARILKHIKYHFEVLQLPARAPPVSLLSPEPRPGLSDSYYL